MCHAASHLHPCGHAGTQWTYCRDSGMTGVGTAPPECDERTWGNSVKSAERCALAYCAFKTGTTWTCCACGGSQNSGGWCLHDRERWEPDTFRGWPNWVEKCEHNCCTNCTLIDGQDGGPISMRESGGENPKSSKVVKRSSGKNGSKKSKKSYGPGDIPVPSVEPTRPTTGRKQGLKERTKRRLAGQRYHLPKGKSSLVSVMGLGLRISSCSRVSSVLVLSGAGPTCSFLG